uniref:SET domain-containing protein n=1 Tax=Panagrellus redivivus TaxID=6233 RepID=A0A7E4UNC1_PANRE
MPADTVSAEARLTAFLNWATKNGIKSPKAELRYVGPDAGYGFFSIDQIRDNEVVIEVPQAVMITSAMICEIPAYNSVLQGFKKALTPAEVLALFIYVEKLNQNSSWKPYLDMLPRDFSTPLYTMPELPVEHLPAKARTCYQEQVTEVNDLKAKLAPIIEAFPDAAPFDETHYLWAWHVVNTRCIYCENRCHELVDTMTKSGQNIDDLALIPLMDMLNHDNEPQCQPGFDRRAEAYRVRAEKFVSDGAQLYVAYGSHDNAKLWINYGFRLPENGLNKVELPLSLILQLAEAVGVKPNERMLQILNDGDNYSCHMYDGIVRIPEGLCQACRLLKMSKDQLKDYNRILQKSRLDEKFHRAVTGLALKILSKLSELLGKRRDAAPDELKWLWLEQIDIVEGVLHPARER